VEVIGNSQLATFAAFGSFATLLLVDFGGPMAERLQAQAALAVTGGVFVCLATLASQNAWLAAVAMAVVGFGVIFAGGRLVRAVRRDLLGDDGKASATAVRMIWTGDHLDVVRRLQAAIISPARATAGPPAADRIIPPLPRRFLALRR
jgi:hypothetical protein